MSDECVHARTIRNGFRGRQHGLRLDPSLELLMQAFNCIRVKVKSLSPASS
jgi:hypothetical protein